MYDFDRPRTARPDAAGTGVVAGSARLAPCDRHPRAPREGDVRIPAGCAIAAIMDRSGARHDGSDILRSIALMHDRGNGLRGGFAAYGIYPEYEELYAFHIMYESDEARRETEAYLDTYFMSEKQERIPTEPVATPASSERISPKMLVVSITSKREGLQVSSIAALSTSRLVSCTSG